MLDDRELLYNIACLYYKDGLTQQEISEKLKISRPMISRALAKAQEVGIVRIDVLPPAGFSEIELELAEKLGIRRVVVAPAVNKSGSEYERSTQDIVDCASSAIWSFIEPGMKVGIGWGKTIYRTALSLKNPENPVRNTTFVPLVGSAGRNEPYYQVNVIVNRFAEKLNGNQFFLNIPAFLKNQQLVDYVLGDTQLQNIKSVWSSLDVAVIGLGAFLESPSFPMGEYSDEDIEKLRNGGVVGDILGRFFNEEGFVLGSGREGDACYPKASVDGEESVYLGIPVGDLRKVKSTICLSGGQAKIPGIVAGAKIGLFDYLITDTYTAKEILEK